jgi:hypothetical protein
VAGTHADLRLDAVALEVRVLNAHLDGEGDCTG